MSDSRINQTERVELRSTSSFDRIVKIVGESFNRFRQSASGLMEWGSGSASSDTNLYRGGTATLQTDSSLSTPNLLITGEAVASGKVSRMPKVAKVALNAADTAGGVFAYNPGVDCVVTRVLINRTTASTGACTLDIGIAADATTLNDTLIDGLNANATAGVADNVNDAGTNGKARQRMTSSQYVTGSVASGASAGLVGFAYIEFIEI